MAAHAQIAEVFPRCDLAAFRRCWQLPCLLTLRDTSVAIADEAAFESVFGGMMEQLRAQGLFETADLQADPGLGDPQPLCSSGKAAGFGHGHEYCQAVEIRRFDDLHLKSLIVNESITVIYI